MIELEAIGKRFGAVDAVKSVSLTIAEGEFVSLLGPSGCGKTTTLRIIAGFESPTSGSLRIGGRDMAEVPVERRGLSMVFQNYALFPHLSVFENVAFGLRLKRVAKAELETRVRKALDQVGLANLGERSPRQLSGGQQQRVSLARGLVVNPKVLLMDEPLSNLDLKLREQLRDEIRALQRSLGMTAVYVTHDQGEAMAMSDRIAVMHGGGIEQVGLPREIYERPSTSFVASFIGQCNLLPGTLDGSGGLFRTPRGVALRVAGTRPSAAKGLRLAIRPETVRFVASSERNNAGSDNLISGQVTDIVYLGDIAQVSVAMAAAGGVAETLDAAWRIVRGEPLPEIGDSVRLAVATADCIPVFDRDA
ncbi:ABC transporter ATP-binding protein [Bosea sp. BK604]|uniref:ABC transporter ATP-binding protein n=1 Tax=Bosea sp. BK604 TaxID=2512180 RepID=UPI00104AC941|nr:ABC transporter ATP-binding protein [Bosea sp. BK604]TCR60574.1 putative spermidine/putrescine transport system ATP-binding protein/spermidine/putrescine transport system ATP-binding protein [Bosea sp. BK604]